MVTPIYIVCRESQKEDNGLVQTVKLGTGRVVYLTGNVIPTCPGAGITIGD